MFQPSHEDASQFLMYAADTIGAARHNLEELQNDIARVAYKRPRQEVQFQVQMQSQIQEGGDKKDQSEQRELELLRYRSVVMDAGAIFLKECFKELHKVVCTKNELTRR